MRLSKLLFIIIAIAICGGIAYIASTEVDINQQTVTQTIPNDRFYSKS